MFIFQKRMYTARSQMRYLTNNEETPQLIYKKNRKQRKSQGKIKSKCIKQDHKSKALK